MTRAGEAFDLLRAANPVPSGRTARRPHRRTRVVLAFAAILLCFLLVAPAVGIRVPPLDFWSAEKAPPKVVQDFETLSEGAPPGMDPGAVPGETRKVRLADGQTLWVAPTRHGGFCTDGGCDKLGTNPMSVSWNANRIPARHAKAPLPIRFVEWIAGHVNGKYAAAAEVRFTDGDSEPLELAWVSEPINAGFFHYAIPDGREIASVDALDADGQVIARDDGGRAPPAAPQPDAVVERKRVALRVDTDRGEAVIWKAPTRYEGRCTWFEFRGTRSAVGRCMAKGYERQVGFGLAVRAVHGESFLVGVCGYAAIELLHGDGSSRRVKCRDGLALARLRPADLAGEMQAVDAAGRPLTRSRLLLNPRPPGR